MWDGNKNTHNAVGMHKLEGLVIAWVQHINNLMVDLEGGEDVLDMLLLLADLRAWFITGNYTMMLQ